MSGIVFLVDEQSSSPEAGVIKVPTKTTSASSISSRCSKTLLTALSIEIKARTSANGNVATETVLRLVFLDRMKPHD